MDTSILRGSKAHILNGFFFPKVVETTTTFRDLRESLCSQYPWSPGNVVDMCYFDISEQRFVPLTYDEHLGLLFAVNVGSHFGKIHIDVLQPCKARDPKGKGVWASSGVRA